MHLSDSKEDFAKEIEENYMGLLDVMKTYKSIKLSHEEFFTIS